MLLNYYYNYLNKKIVLHYINSNNKKDKYEFLANDLYTFVVCDDEYRADKVYKNWDGKNVYKSLITKSNKKISKYNLLHYFLKNSDFETQDKIFCDAVPPTVFMDIETEITDDLTASLDTEKAENKIISISLLFNNTIFFCSLKDISNDEKIEIKKYIYDYLKNNTQIKENTFKYKFLYFLSEEQMLDFVIYFLVKEISIITGWNVNNYDIPYLIKRAENLNIPSLKKMNYYKSKNGIIFKDIVIIDYLNVYQKYDMTITVKENMKLDTAGRDVLGIQKINFNYSLKDLYLNNYKKFIIYNIIDVLLVYYINEKLGLLQILYNISYMSKIPLMFITSAVISTEYLIFYELLEKNLVMAEKDNMDIKKESYIGGYVKQPESGLHFWVGAFDFNSLYPTTARQFNISPETLKYVITNNQEINNIRQMIADKKITDIIVTPNGAVYDATKDGYYRSIMEKLYGKRLIYKKNASLINNILKKLS